MLTDFVMGMVAEEIRRSDRSRSDDGAGASPDRYAAQVTAQAPEFTSFARVVRHMAGLSPESRFEFGLGVVLDGLDHRLRRH